MERKINLQESWNKISPYYQKKYGDFVIFYEKTIHMDLFGSLKNKKLLDLGCGGGQTSIFFAKQGAIVTGIDFSKKQINFAKALAKKDAVKQIFFQKGDMENLSMFKNCNFDLVNSSHAIHYLKNPEKCFNEVFRVLKPKGKFVFSVSHPLNHIVDLKNNQLVIKRSYFQKNKYQWNWEYPEHRVKYPIFLFTRKIDDYFTALRQSGFIVENLVEPQTNLDQNSPWRNPSEPREELIPGALIFGARK